MSNAQTGKQQTADSKQPGIVPREIWLERRAADLACSIHVAMAFGEGNHEEVQRWIDELQDIWPLIES